eukprot:2440232-Rhodomonas_salina.1
MADVRCHAVLVAFRIASDGPGARPERGWSKPARTGEEDAQSKRARKQGGKATRKRSQWRERERERREHVRGWDGGGSHGGRDRRVRYLPARSVRHSARYGMSGTGIA